jgi:chromosome segregation ATPase
MLGLPTKSTSSLENSKNQNTKNKFINNSNQTINIMTKSLPELLKETEEMEVKLATINSEMDKERNLLTQENLELNTQITDRGFEISCLSTENKNLISQLKDIKTSLDDKMKLSKIFLAKTEQLKKNEKNLKKKIDVLEKEIVLAQKNNQITQKDCTKIKNLLKNNEEGKEKILNEELDNLIKLKSELEENNFKLRKALKEHKLCPKIKSNLVNKLNMLNNSYEFEKKKTNMLETNMVNLEQKKEKIKKEIQDKEEFNANNRSISYCSNLRKKVLKHMEKKNSEYKVMSPTARMHVSNICNSIEEQNKKNSELIKNIDNTNYQKLKKNLFTDSEQVQLAAIIPPSFLNEFKERFEMVENERYDLMNKLQKNKNKLNGYSDDIQIKINYAELKKKEQKMQWVDMNVNYSKKNVEINNLKNEIKKVNKEFRNWTRLLKMKNNENQKLNEHITNIQNKGRIHTDNDDTKYNDNNNIYNKKKPNDIVFDSRYQKQNNIKLFYKNKKNE